MKANNVPPDDDRRLERLLRGLVDCERTITGDDVTSIMHAEELIGDAIDFQEMRTRLWKTFI